MEECLTNMCHLNWMMSLFSSGYYRFHEVIYCVKMCHKIWQKSENLWIFCCESVEDLWSGHREAGLAHSYYAGLLR